MQEHAPELLQLALWTVGALGALIVALFGLGVAIVRWAITRYEDGRMAENEALNQRLDVQDATLKSIKDFISKELYDLREWIHRLDKDVALIRHLHLRGDGTVTPHRKGDNGTEDV